MLTDGGVYQELSIALLSGLPTFRTFTFAGSGSHRVHVMRGLNVQVSYGEHKYFMIS